MAKYELLSGPFAGEVVEEGQILPSRFSDLDDDMQIRVRQFGEDKYLAAATIRNPISLFRWIS